MTENTCELWKTYILDVDATSSSKEKCWLEINKSAGTQTVCLKLIAGT